MDDFVAALFMPTRSARVLPAQSAPRRRVYPPGSRAMHRGGRAVCPWKSGMQSPDESVPFRRQALFKRAASFSVCGSKRTMPLTARIAVGICLRVATAQRISNHQIVWFDPCGSQRFIQILDGVHRRVRAWRRDAEDDSGPVVHAGAHAWPLLAEPCATTATIARRCVEHDSSSVGTAAVRVQLAATDGNGQLTFREDGIGRGSMLWVLRNTARIAGASHCFMWILGAILFARMNREIARNQAIPSRNC